MSWSSGASSSISSRSYWPSTRVDIQPSSIPSCAPATVRATGASGSAGRPDCPPSAGRRRSSHGRKSRLNEAMLAAIQPARSVTLALAGPANERRPVSAATSSSASAVRTSKSGCSEAKWYDDARGSRPATRTATRSARSQAIGSVIALLLLRVLHAHDFDQVPDEDGEDGQDRAADQHDGDPVGPHCGGQQNGRSHACTVAAAVRKSGRLVARSGDLLAPRARHAHRLVLVAVLPVVVDREAGVAARLPTGPVLTEGPRRALVAADGMPPERSLAHDRGQRRGTNPYSARGCVICNTPRGAVRSAVGVRRPRTGGPRRCVPAAPPAPGPGTSER